MVRDLERFGKIGFLVGFDEIRWDQEGDV